VVFFLFIYLTTLLTKYDTRSWVGPIKWIKLSHGRLRARSPQQKKKGQNEILKDRAFRNYIVIIQNIWKINLIHKFIPLTLCSDFFCFSTWFTISLVIMLWSFFFFFFFGILNDFYNSVLVWSNGMKLACRSIKLKDKWMKWNVIMEIIYV